VWGNTLEDGSSLKDSPLHDSTTGVSMITKGSLRAKMFPLTAVGKSFELKGWGKEQFMVLRPQEDFISSSRNA
jgi:hypothetical protein